MPEAIWKILSKSIWLDKKNKIPALIPTLIKIDIVLRTFSLYATRSALCALSDNIPLVLGRMYALKAKREPP